MQAAPPLIDAHAHLDRYGDHLAAALEELRALRILTMAVAMDLASYRATEAMARTEPLVLPAFGIHPWNAVEYADRLDEIGELARNAPAIGEIGLDHHFVTERDQYPAQRAVFERLLAAASDTGKLVNLHTKGAEAAVARILRTTPLAAIVVHWYSGPAAPLEALIDLGAYFTIGVEVLTSPAVQGIARRIPADRLLTETDNPGGWAWLSGEPGVPSLIVPVVEKLAEVRGMPVREMRGLVADNFRSLLAAGSLEPPAGVLEQTEAEERR